MLCSAHVTLVSTELYAGTNAKREGIFSEPFKLHNFGCVLASEGCGKVEGLWSLNSIKYETSFKTNKINAFRN
jgi:hypothetical protein